MRNGPIVLFAFAGIMAVLAAVTFVFSSADLITHLLLAGTAAAPLVVGLVVLAMRAPDPEAPAALVDLSPASALVALGVVAMVVGAEAGPWLILIGAGMTALGLGGLVRERRARRR